MLRRKNKTQKRVLLQIGRSRKASKEIHLTLDKGTRHEGTSQAKIWAKNILSKENSNAKPLRQARGLAVIGEESRQVLWELKGQKRENGMK